MIAVRLCAAFLVDVEELGRGGDEKKSNKTKVLTLVGDFFWGVGRREIRLPSPQLNGVTGLCFFFFFLVQMSL